MLALLKKSQLLKNGSPLQKIIHGVKRMYLQVLGGGLLGMAFSWVMYISTPQQIVETVQLLLEYAETVHQLVAPLFLGGLAILRTGMVWKKQTQDRIIAEKLPLDSRGKHTVIALATLTLAITGTIFENWLVGIFWLLPGLAALRVIYLQSQIDQAINHSDSGTATPDKKTVIECKSNCLMILGITVMGIALLLLKS